MPQTTGDERQPFAPEQSPPAEPPSAGALYRRHLERFPERRSETALERAARALIRAAQLRLKAPRKPD